MHRHFVEVTHHGTVLASKAIWAHSIHTRWLGLRGTKELVPGRDGCLLDPCRQIHCRGMKYPIDTIHLDKNDSVVGVERVAVWKTGSRIKGSRKILEVAEGEIERMGIKVGDTLSITPVGID